MPKTLLVLAAFTLSTNHADAQGFLNRLKDKAVKAVQDRLEREVDNKVDNAVDKATGLKTGKKADKKSATPAAANASAKSSGNDDAVRTEGYAEGLAEYIYNCTEFEIGVGATATYNFANYKEALNAMPSVPTADDLLNENSLEAQKKKWNDFLFSVSDFGRKQQEMMLALQGEIQSSSNKIAGNRPASTANAMEMAEYVMSLPAAEQKKLESFGDNNSAEALAYIKTKHPKLYALMMKQMSSGAKQPASVEANEERINQYDALRGRLSVYYDRMVEGMGATEITPNMLNSTGATLAKGTKLSADLKELREKVKDEWLASDECKKINEMEADLQKRQREWEVANGKQNELFTVYAPFFKEGRAKQNQLIAAFNKRTAEKWLATIAKNMEANKADAEDVADCSEKFMKLVATRSKTDVAESITINTYIGMEAIVSMLTVHKYLAMPTEVFSFPMVPGVELDPAGV